MERASPPLSAPAMGQEPRHFATLQLHLAPSGAPRFLSRSSFAHSSMDGSTFAFACC
ncbi:hypothetical protein BDP55DRAFT_666351 [Colletotrichum godetiae]|uniref:Uncharacterized protein n=1 Tax=Colletotrichum godetiae TaxID=1209918 RepID=A0AAJ0AJ21_9PEZI|nr:uncharacterized protein BDP55DRAFT_666351 [Colletotrichum godetiae]KAK1674801.1 hypothetical protein BDP55DRAFT_666351 [Colletotrichum godetiae]